MALYSLKEALAPRWYEAYLRLGMPEDANPQQVAVWQASRREGRIIPDLEETVRRRAL